MNKPKSSCLGAVAITALAALTVTLAAAGSASSAAAAKVLAKVNGTEITDEDVKIAAEDLGANLPAQLDGKAQENYVLDFLIDGELVAAKAKADKLDQTPEFTKKLAYQREKLLMETLLGQIARTAVTEAALQATYEEAKQANKPETEVHARHILVAEEADAKAALQRVKGGEDFAKVAEEVSKDPGSKGGDLGWFTKSRMVPEFAEAAFKLEPGQISDPVKSAFGWHIIKLEGKRETTFPPFAEVKDQVARYVVQKAQGELIGQLRKSAKIERTEPPPPPPGEAAKPDAAKGEAPKTEPPKPESKK
jgi:peptidyl-prolyl cis-trans isomerase C